MMWIYLGIAFITASVAVFWGLHKWREMKNIRKREIVSKINMPVCTVDESIYMVDEPIPSRCIVDNLSTNNRACRKFYFRITASLAELLSNAENAATLLIKNADEVRYRKHGSAIGSKRGGDVTSGLILKANMVWTNNTFPVAMVLKSNDVSLRGSYYVDTNSRGFMILAPSSTHQHEKTDVIGRAEEEIIRLWNDKAIRYSVYYNKAHGDNYLVSPYSKLGKIIAEHTTNYRKFVGMSEAELLSDDRLIARMTEENYLVDKSTLDFALGVLDEMVNRTITNFNTLTISTAPVTYNHPTVDMNQQHFIEGVIELTYHLLPEFEEVVQVPFMIN
jgi:hypothetical protein